MLINATSRRLIIRVIRKARREFKNLFFYRNRIFNLWLWKIIENRRASLIIRQAKFGVTSSLSETNFDILIVVEEKVDLNAIEVTILSILRQYYPVQSLRIILPGNVTHNNLNAVRQICNRDTRIALQVKTDNDEILGVMSNPKGWTCFIRPGDILKEWALFQIVMFIKENPSIDFLYADEMQFDTRGCNVPFLKPDWSPDFLLARNYVGHFVSARNEILEPGGWKQFSYYDMNLRLTERSNQIAHVPDILYQCNCRVHNVQRDVEALNDALSRRGILGKVEVQKPGQYNVQYQVMDTRLGVSIIIPTKDHIDLLRRCIGSIRLEELQNVEIIVVDNGSVETQSHIYFNELRSQPGFKVLEKRDKFNYSGLNNLAVLHSTKNFVLFMNNDVEVITKDWLDIMMGHAQQARVGAVGVKLLYPTGKVQHGGDVVGMYGAADHAFRGLSMSNPGYMNYLQSTRNVSAVTAACLMMRRDVFDSIGGFDENFDVAFNDVDLCLRVREKGYDIVWTPNVLLNHHESASRGMLHPEENTRLFQQKWATILTEGDPFYHPRLSRDGIDYMFDVSPITHGLKRFLASSRFTN